MNLAEDSVATFQARRPFLLGLAYRILGSRAEAEDAVQDLFRTCSSNGWRPTGPPSPPRRPG